MKIGIDIDGVLTDIERFTVDYLTKFCFENNIEYLIGKSNYEAYKTFAINKIDEDTFWNEYLIYYSKKINARPFASEIVKKLKEDGHEIYIITARWTTNRNDNVGTNMRKIVECWLAENDIIYDKLIFSKALNENKHQEVIDNQIDLMIEDSPKNINVLSKNVKVICFDTSYNRKCKGKNIIRAYSWYDIYRNIKMISK